MKLGNTSQSIVPVPNFYYTRDLKPMDTFNISLYNKRYFKEKDLLRQTQDININNNPRNRNRKYNTYNKVKFVPLHRVDMNQSEPPEILTTVKYDSEDSDVEANQVTLTQNTTKPRIIRTVEQEKRNQLTEYHTSLNQTSNMFRNEIKRNIDDLIDRLGKRLDTNRNYNTDTAENYYKTNAETYSLITAYNRTNDNDTIKFKKDIKSKIESLSSYPEERKAKVINDLFNKDMEVEKVLPYITAHKKFNETLDGFVNKGSEIGSRLNFYRTHGSEIITNYNKGTICPPREELFKPREKREEFLIDESKYQSTKARRMFCEDYDHQEFMKTYINN
jgi:hypothetical protein